MLGFSRYTDEYYYWNCVKIETSRALQRLKRDLRWNVPALEGVSVDMQRSGVNKGAIVNEEFREGEVLPPTQAREDRTRAQHNIAVKQADWLRHVGATGCPNCIHARDHRWGWRTAQPEIPVQEEQSQSIPITEAPGARGVRGVIGIGTDEVLAETPTRC